MPERSRILEPALGALLVAFPVTILTVPHAGSGILGVLTLGGLVAIAVGGRRPLARLARKEKRLLLIVTAFVAVAILGWLLGGRLENGISNLRRYVRLLAVVPVYLLLVRVRPREHWLRVSLAAGAVACGLFAIWDGWWIPRPADYRVTGGSHFILFGDLTLAMGFMAFAGWFPGRPGRDPSWGRDTVVATVALGLGLVASLFSGTRGAWLAVPGLVLILFWYHWPGMAPRLRVGLVVAVVVAGLATYAIPQTGVRARAEIAVTEVKCYLAGERCYGASGGRLDMWKAALRMFRSSPVFGVGVGGYRLEARRYAERGEMIEIVSRFDHPHNEYMSVLASRGVVGLVALLALLALPFRWYARAARSRAGPRALAGLSGMLLAAAYAQFALTESVFERSRFVAFFVVYTALCCYLTIGRDD